MERLGGGRMADVMAVDDDWVVKLDKAEFYGTAEYEAALLEQLRAVGVPVPRVDEVVEVDGRSGFKMERLHGPLLSGLIGSERNLAHLARVFVDEHLAINAIAAPALSDLRSRLIAEIEASGLEPTVASGLVSITEQLVSPTGVCHFDFHPDNIIATASGWRVVDWIGAASGPTHADFARTLVLRADSRSATMRMFMSHVRAGGQAARSLASDEVDEWMRVVAAARLVEGFDEEYRDWLDAIAHGLSSGLSAISASGCGGRRCQ